MRQHRITMVFSTLLGISITPIPSKTWAQDTGGLPRTVNERVLTETPVPPPANSDALRTAEGKLAPGVPAPQGAIDPGRISGATGPARDQAMDPAMRFDPAVRAPARLGSYPPGMDAAIVAEHALGMAIEASALRAIADRAGPGQGGDESAKMLRIRADRLVSESQAILGRGANEARDPAGSSPALRFNRAIRDYIATLVTFAGASPSDVNQMALINHAVKEVLDADHIRQMSHVIPGGMAMEQLLIHARNMRDEGTQTVLRMAGSGTSAPGVSANMTTLARRGREVIEAAGELGAIVAAQATIAPAVAAPIGPNPGRPQEDRPAIIGGTYGRSNPTTGTYSGKDDPLNPAGPPKVQNTGSPVPSPSDRNNSTTSSGGLPPR